MKSMPFLAALAGLGLMVTGGPTHAASPLIGTDHADIQWTHELDGPKAGAVETAPNQRSVLLVQTHDSLGLTVNVMGKQGHLRWYRVWHGPGGRIKGVTGSALAVSTGHRAVLVAGTVICRGSEPDSLGPAFVRRYSLRGEPRWTRWIGSCPAKSSASRTPALSVSGLDVWRDSVALTYTKGRSGDCCEHHRTGHVVVLDMQGSPEWRSVVPFAGRRIEEVITSDITVTQGVLIVSGTVIRRATAEDAYLIAMSLAGGAERWRYVTAGQSELNVDEYEDLDSARGAVFVNGSFDDAFEGGGGTYVLERWRTTGKRVWRTRVLSHASVSALRNGSVLWSAIDYFKPRERLVIGRHRPSGDRAWRDSFRLKDDDYPIGYTFAATKRMAVGSADILRPQADVLQVWGWRIR